jgi:hypothetical protein
VAHSKARVEVAACSRTGDEAVVCSGPGSRAVGSDMMVSRVTEE